MHFTPYLASAILACSAAVVAAPVPLALSNTPSLASESPSADSSLPLQWQASNRVRARKRQSDSEATTRSSTITPPSKGIGLEQLPNQRTVQQDAQSKKLDDPRSLPFTGPSIDAIGPEPLDQSELLPHPAPGPLPMLREHAKQDDQAKSNNGKTQGKAQDKTRQNDPEEPTDKPIGPPIDMFKFLPSTKEKPWRASSGSGSYDSMDKVQS